MAGEPSPGLRGSLLTWASGKQSHAQRATDIPSYFFPRASEELAMSWPVSLGAYLLV